MRWVASMVAEVHRILTRGGIFMYPIDSKTKEKGGKLRLMYEASPMSFIVEQAGGASSTGRERIMTMPPKGLPQRVPVILGSKNEVEKVALFHNDKKKPTQHTAAVLLPGPGVVAGFFICDWPRTYIASVK